MRHVIPVVLIAASLTDSQEIGSVLVGNELYGYAVSWPDKRKVAFIQAVDGQAGTDVKTEGLPATRIGCPARDHIVPPPCLGTLLVDVDEPAFARRDHDPLQMHRHGQHDIVFRHCPRFGGEQCDGKPWPAPGLPVALHDIDTEGKVERLGAKIVCQKGQGL